MGRSSLYDPSMSTSDSDTRLTAVPPVLSNVGSHRSTTHIPGHGDKAANGHGNGDAPARPRRPSQRRRLSVDRKTFDFYHDVLGYSKVLVAEVNGYALGGGFELALMADISVVGAGTQIGMPATRFLGPALGTLHMFFYRLGPVLARRLLLTGDIISASDLAHLSVFTEVVVAPAYDDDALYVLSRASAPRDSLS